jgi:phage gpG-like protein
MTPGQAAAALANLPIAETLTTALTAQANRLADAIRATLATPPGGPHDHPWRQTGALQSSIATTIDGLTAQIGSNDPAAAPQEMGTATTPPRPFLAPPATALAEPIAHDIGQALAALLTRRMA